MGSRAVLRSACQALACLALLGLPSLAAADSSARAAPRSLLERLGDGPEPGVRWNLERGSPSQPAETRRIRVAAFEVEGNVSFDDGELARVLAPFTGRLLALDELRQAVEALLAHYRSYGYLATRVALPPQRIESGVVRLVVQDGALDPDAVRGLALAAPLEAAGARAARRPAVPPAPAESPPATTTSFYRALPSSRPSAALLDSEASAADRLVVELEEGPARDFGPESDLFARPPDGGWRVGATFQMANPAGRGGFLSARGVTDGTGVPFFSAHFDTPLDVAASTLAAPGRFLDDELVQDLDGRQADGRSTALELAAERPLVEGTDFDLALRARLRHREQIDEAAGATLADKRIDSAQLSTRGRLRDGLLGGGTTAASFSTTLGHTDLDGHPAYARADAEGARTAGGFARFRASLARLQSLDGPWSLFGSVMAQAASKNLDGSQQFSIGGLAPERGFAVGEAFGDEGFRLNADLRYAVPQPVLGGRLQIAAFYDQGALRLRRQPAGGGGNVIEHRSLGLALRQDWSDSGFVHLSAGRQIGGDLAAGQDPEGDRPYRFWLRLGMAF